MPQAFSLHIGLNRVDTSVYPGAAVLAGCINDANDMEAICRSRGFQTRKLLDDQATCAEVLRCIGQIAQQMGGDDLFVLTYSGHGSQVRDVDGDEADGQDETWCLYDRMLVDDELWSLWSQFPSGARIFLLSDSCHSGTVARVLGYSKMVQETVDLHATTNRSRGMRDASVPRQFRLLPPEIAARVIVAANGDYDSRQWVAGAKTRDVGATVILISGCQDNQLSSDGTGNGLFTENLKAVWDNGSFVGGHEAFASAIQARMPSYQTPNYYVVGSANAAFEAETPFTVGAGAPAVPTPTPAPSPTPSPAPTPSGGSRPTLRRPARGSDVLYLQNRLSAHGYSVSVDGDFGPSTEAVVCEFQRDHRLIADGVVGPETWDALEAAPSGATPSQPSTPAPTPSPTPSPTSPQAPSGPRRTLRRGDRGDEVRYLQQLLLELDYVLTVDGDFGPTTESRVRSFQSSNGLTSDGVVGARTWDALLSQTGRMQPA